MTSAIMLCVAERIESAALGEMSVLTALRDEVRAQLATHDVAIGYTAAMPGAEIIFAEELLARSGELHLALPCPADIFAMHYVAPAGDEWVARFHAVRAAAKSVEVSCEEALAGDEIRQRFNNQMLQGMARVHAERIGATARLFLVWDPAAPSGPGTPADLMDAWPEMEQLSLVDLEALRERLGVGGEMQSPATDDLASAGTMPLAVRAILFADMATYSTMSDEQVPLLWDFLAEVQQEIEAAAKLPILINTWGDAVHAVAETALDLAQYATVLIDRIGATDPAPFGLNGRPRFRVALHAGPVHVGLHPLTGRSMIYGHHVNRAARIEPVAAIGEIYASQPFAALLQVEMDALQHEARLVGKRYSRPYRMDYVGHFDLPKKFGREAVYSIRAVAAQRAADQAM